MKVSLRISSFALLAAVLAGCGSDASSDEAEPAQPVRNGEPSHPPPPPLEGTPDASELDESLGVFVVAGAVPDGEGTRARPFATIGEGIALAKATRRRVYVCEGTYRESIVIEDGVSIVGGLDCATSDWQLSGGRTRLEATSSPAITAKKIRTSTWFEAFDVIAPDGKEPGASSIGLFAQEATALTISKSVITAGNGAPGAEGAAAIQLQQVGNVDGQPGSGQGDYCYGKTPSLCFVSVQPRPGGSGGVSTCSGAPGHDGERGGNGGTGGVWESVYDPAAVRSLWKVYGRNDAAFGAKLGETRAPGTPADGIPGTSALSPGQITRDGFVPASGSRGTDGAPGKAGSGGRGAAPTANAATYTGDVWYGNNASGGGAGGCPGLAGGEGGGGGASIAAIVIDGVMAFFSVELVAKAGGAGGAGSFGSTPTPGGRGGASVNPYLPSSAGAPGTAGGVSGVSGSGAGGSSFALVHVGRPPVMSATKTRKGEPGAGVPAMTSNGKTISASSAGVAVDVYAAGEVN